MPDILPRLLRARESGLIQAEDLFSLLEDNTPRLRLIDATYPADTSWPKIGRAATFDIDDIADKDSPMAHMLPSPEVFAEKVAALGISNDDFVVCYDRSGSVMAASRAWWMFRVFGHDNVAVLDGGLHNWLAAGYPVGGPEPLPPAEFTSVYRPELVIGYDRMKDISASASALVYDARPPDRFVDHIPGSLNLPALGLLGPDRLLRPTGLALSPDSKIVATCGSGITACLIALSFFGEGRRDVAVYDGSWTEWNSK